MSEQIIFIMCYKILFLGLKVFFPFIQKDIIFLMMVKTGHTPLLRTCDLLEKKEHCFKLPILREHLKSTDFAIESL